MLAKSVQRYEKKTELPNFFVFFCVFLHFTVVTQSAQESLAAFSGDVREQRPPESGATFLRVVRNGTPHQVCHNDIFDAYFVTF